MTASVTRSYWIFWTLSIVRYCTKLENRTLPSSGEGERETSVDIAIVILIWVVQWFRLVLFKEPKRLGVSSPFEDGNRSRYRNVVFYSLLEYRTMDEVQKPCSIRFYVNCFWFGHPFSAWSVPWALYCCSHVVQEHCRGTGALMETALYMGLFMVRLTIMLLGGLSAAKSTYWPRTVAHFM
jgi:hypothetical protein